MCLGIPGRITEIRDEAGLSMGKVDFGGVRKDACLAYLPDVQLGDYVIVHVGFAISKVDEAEAHSGPQPDIAPRAQASAGGPVDSQNEPQTT